MRSLIERRLSLRVRIICLAVLLVGSMLPPYVPRAELSQPFAELEENTPAQFLFVEDGFLMKSSTLGEQGSRLAYSEGILYTVKSGDSIEKIAQEYRIQPDTIRFANGMTAQSTLKPGQELFILPVDGVLHTVRRGQMLSRIAELYDVPAEEIVRQNKISGDFIVAGQQLIIPGGKPIGSAVAQRPDASATEELSFADSLARGNLVQPRFPSRQPSRVLAEPSEVEPTAGVFQMPCNTCFYTQYYNARHYAVDIQTRGGGPIFAAEDGTIIRADFGWNGGYGNVIEVDHGNGLVTLYAHNRDIYVKVGDVVKRGQQIAWMGNTGLVHGTTGIHIHFEVKVNGVKKNPLLYLQ